MTDHTETTPEGFEITAETVKVLRRFTGEGMMACHKAIIRAKGDLLLAAGHLRYDGILVNYKSGNREQRLEEMAKGYAQGLCLVDGKIKYIPEPERDGQNQVVDDGAPSP